MAVALNLIALLLVLGFVWVGMVVMSGYYHRKRLENQQPDGDVDVAWHPPDANDPCPDCGGVGARQLRGSLEPCGSCKGTGVLI